MCNVVTNGICSRRSSSRICAPARPPKIPYSCCRQTRSMLLKFRKSAACRYDARLSSDNSNRTRSGYAVTLFGVVHRQRQQLGRAVFGVNGVAQICRERRDPAVPRQIVPDDCDSIGKRGMRRDRRSDMTDFLLQLMDSTSISSKVSGRGIIFGSDIRFPVNLRLAETSPHCFQSPIASEKYAVHGTSLCLPDCDTGNQRP